MDGGGASYAYTLGQRVAQRRSDLLRHQPSHLVEGGYARQNPRATTTNETWNKRDASWRKRVAAVGYAPDFSRHLLLITVIDQPSTSDCRGRQSSLDSSSKVAAGYTSRQSNDGCSLIIISVALHSVVADAKGKF